jgi:hypothetical protein
MAFGRASRRSHRRMLDTHHRHAPIPQAQQRRAMMDHFFTLLSPRDASCQPVLYPVCQSVACPTPTYSTCLVVCMISHRILRPHQASHNLRSTPRSYFVHRRAALLRSSTLHFAGCILCLELAYAELERDCSMVIIDVHCMS